jgi:hypothetical protein
MCIQTVLGECIEKPFSKGQSPVFGLDLCIVSGGCHHSRPVIFLQFKETLDDKLLPIIRKKLLKVVREC